MLYCSCQCWDEVLLPAASRESCQWRSYHTGNWGKCLGQNYTTWHQHTNCLGTTLQWWVWSNYGRGRVSQTKILAIYHCTCAFAFYSWYIFLLMALRLKLSASIHHLLTLYHFAGGENSGLPQVASLRILVRGVGRFAFRGLKLIIWC